MIPLFIIKRLIPDEPLNYVESLRSHFLKLNISHKASGSKESFPAALYISIKDYIQKFLLCNTVRKWIHMFWL